tara:strand:- start:215 stop:589 length:375 start_codon:yes stop_codon:yes gene_type:complete
MFNIEENMPETTKNQKSTAMDYLSAPRDTGLIKNLMSLLGFMAPIGGRLPAGVKYDTVVALNDVFAVEANEEFVSMLTTRIMELQSARRKSTLKVSATPESIISAVRSGKINLEELKLALAKMD